MSETDLDLKPVAAPVTAVDLKSMLRKRYPREAYALIFEVGNATGFNCNRHLDAMAMSLWPSRGLDLIGFEIKVTRSDWKRELDNPAKSSTHIRFLDRFYLVVGNDKIVGADELPSTWGLMIATGRGLKVLKEAPKLAAEPVDRTFLAALMKRTNELVPKAREEARREAERTYFGQVQALQEELRILKLRTDNSRTKVLEAFEAAAGIKLNEDGYGWNGNYKPDVAGAAVRAILKGELEMRLSSMEHWAASMRRIADELDQTLAAATLKENNDG